MTNTMPHLSTPLVTDPSQQSPGANMNLGDLTPLLGTWTNQPLTESGPGGQDNPFSYCLMPLPQVDPSSPAGYILKNFSYYEEITFSAIHGTAPNRGGMGTQVGNAIFYEQRVYFAEGPDKDALVHAENGSWLYLTDSKQLLGPYGDNNGPNVGTEHLVNSEPPTQDFDIAKQVSVPHGNSILALGYADTRPGPPTIPNAPDVAPGGGTFDHPTMPHYGGVNIDPYNQASVGNPSVKLTKNPNLQLQKAANVNDIEKHIQIIVDSHNGKGNVSNIGFEQQHAQVTRYAMTLWLESLDGTNYDQLQYSQTILMNLVIGGKTISFPHVTTNTLRRVSP